MEGGKWLKSSLTFLYQVLTKNLIINKQNSRIKTAQICFILSSFSTVCSYFESPALVFPSSWLTDEDFALVVLLQLSPPEGSRSPLIWRKRGSEQEWITFTPESRGLNLNSPAHGSPQARILLNCRWGFWFLLSVKQNFLNLRLTMK